MKKGRWIRILMLATAVVMWSACATEGGDETDVLSGVDAVEQGAKGGPCYNNNTCNEGLACEGGACVACEGDEGCACYPNQTCESGLECSAGACVTGAPLQGCVGCVCLSDGSCNEGLECDAADLCQPKEGTETGCASCPCGEGGSCDEGLLCDALSICEVDGPGEDGATIIGDYPVVAGGGDCPKVTADNPVPWVCQKMTYISTWDGAMCCGPACITAVKGYVDNDWSLGDSQLEDTVDWMDLNIPYWSKKGYKCTGTGEDQMVTTLMEYVGVDAQAMSISWCDLLDKLDGSHIVIFYGDTQGGNSSTVFKAGDSHWLILERTDAQFAYVDDPGRTYASDGDSKKFTLNSVQNRYETLGSLAIIVSVGPVQCPNAPSGSITYPSDGDSLCGEFDVSGDVTDYDGIQRITVEIDGDKDCKFSKEVSGAPTANHPFSIPVYPDGPSCNLSDGPHEMVLWVKDECDKAEPVHIMGFQYECCDCTGDVCCDGCDFASYGTSCGPCKLCNSSGGCLLNEPDDTPCGGGKQCQNGQCIAKSPECGDGECNGSDTKCNCPVDCGSCSGCCSGSTCKGGTADTVCGSNGGSCTNCDAAGKICQSQQCVAKQPECGDGECNGSDTKCNCPGDCGSCSGCCSGSTCKSGTSDSSCGMDGDACVNCSSSGKDCLNKQCETPESGCHIERVYPAGSSSWTYCPGVLQDHELWKAKSDSPDGNYADITFTKCPDGGGPSTNVKYWVVVGVENPTDFDLCMPFNAPPPTCDSLSCCRTTGTWQSSKDSLTVSVKLWPNDADISPAHDGEIKTVYIETGGGAAPGDENKPIWYSVKALKYEMVCD